MKTRLIMIATALMTSLFCLPATAQPGGGMNGTGMGGMGSDTQQAQRGTGPRGSRDCMQTANPSACQAHQTARQQARAACQDKAGPARRECMKEQMRDYKCSQSANPQQCEARKIAYQDCKGQTGPAFRQCVQQKMPAADCSAAKNPARCEQHQKARLACQDKMGPEHKACLREQFKMK